MKAIVSAVTAAACLSLLASAEAPAQPGAARAIEHVAGDLYRAQNNQHYTVFLVTPEGIVVSDPINVEFAAWLEDELGDRFDVPVRYVLYSHHHWDHASGGDVFADTAELVGHESMPSLVERQAAESPQADVEAPDQLFGDRRTITLGGKRVEMIHVGPAHSEDLTVLRFPEERAVFLVDFVSVKRLPFQTLPGYDIDQVVDTIGRVEALDFEIAVGGHGDIGTKQDVADHRVYLEELRAAVQAGIDAGHSLEQIRASVTMDDYSDWGAYEQWLPLNVEGMHRILTAEP